MKQTEKDLEIKELTEKDLKAMSKAPLENLENVEELYFQAKKVDKCSINNQQHTHLIAKDKKDISNKKWPLIVGTTLMSFITLTSIVLICWLLFKLFA